MSSKSRKDQLEQETSVLSDTIENRKSLINDLTSEISDLKRYNNSDEIVLKIRREELSKTKSI